MKKIIAIFAAGVGCAFLLHADQPEWRLVPEILAADRRAEISRA